MIYNCYFNYIFTSITKVSNPDARCCNFCHKKFWICRKSGHNRVSSALSSPWRLAQSHWHSQYETKGGIFTGNIKRNASHLRLVKERDSVCGQVQSTLSMSLNSAIADLMLNRNAVSNNLFKLPSKHSHNLHSLYYTLFKPLRVSGRGGWLCQSFITDSRPTQRRRSLTLQRVVNKKGCDWLHSTTRWRRCGIIGLCLQRVWKEQRLSIVWKAVVDVPCNLQRVVEDSSTTRCRLHGTSTTAFHTRWYSWDEH